MFPLIFSPNIIGTPNQFPCSVVFLPVNIDVRVNPEFYIPFLDLCFYGANAGFILSRIYCLFASHVSLNGVAVSRVLA